MATATAHRVDWNLIWAQRGFRYFFVAMFVSLFGSGMNFVAVSWYIMASTHSTVKVSLQVIVVTLPGLLIPFLGGVLIDRFDRRSATVTALVGLPQEVPYTSAFVFLLAAIAFSRFNWRCPVCGAHLVGNDPASCHHCHVALR